MQRRTRRIALCAVLVSGLAFPASASADLGSKVVYQCLHTGSVSDTWPQAAYTQALHDLGADSIEYSDCAQQIRAAQLAAAARGAGGRGAASSIGGAPVVAASSFTPKERAAIAALASPSTGGAPVPVGGHLVQPGLVHVDLASAVSTLPTPLKALLAILAAAALLALGRAVRHRVGDRGAH
jgi:hypothetical protein